MKELGPVGGSAPGMPHRSTNEMCSVPNYAQATWSKRKSDVLLVFHRKILCDGKPKPVSKKIWPNHGSFGGGITKQFGILPQTTKCKLSTTKVFGSLLPPQNANYQIASLE